MVIRISNHYYYFIILIGGYFVFTIIFPPTFPNDAPFIKLQTTGGGQIRFNPNLYKNGKVCLSILGTKGGQNDWSPAQTLTGILLSIQVNYLLRSFFNNYTTYAICYT